MYPFFKATRYALAKQSNKEQKAKDPGNNEFNTEEG